METLKRIDRQFQQKCSIFDLYKDTIQLPDGTITQWDFLMHKGAAAVIPVTSEGKIIMVKQLREAIDKLTIEIPAGGLNQGETFADAAARELEEETGYSNEGELEFLISLYSVPAYCNERIDVFVARNLKPSKQMLDQDEFIEVYEYELKDLVDKILTGELQDAKTIASIMSYKAKYNL